MCSMHRGREGCRQIVAGLTRCLPLAGHGTALMMAPETSMARTIPPSWWKQDTWRRVSCKGDKNSQKCGQETKHKEWIPAISPSSCPPGQSHDRGVGGWERNGMDISASIHLPLPVIFHMQTQNENEGVRHGFVARQILST